MDWVAGTAPFYRREVFDMAGYLDEHFVMYHEDIEFGLRLRNKTGYKLCVFADKLVRHYLQSAQPVPRKLDRMYYYGHRNHILLLRKHCPRYVPKILARQGWEVAGWLLVPILTLRPRAFLFSLRITVPSTAGMVAGLVARLNRS